MYLLFPYFVAREMFIKTCPPFRLGQIANTVGAGFIGVCLSGRGSLETCVAEGAAMSALLRLGRMFLDQLAEEYRIQYEARLSKL